MHDAHPRTEEPHAPPFAAARPEEELSRAPLARALKRALDVALSGAGLLATAPLLGALAALIRADSEGPALYHQQRTGLGQRPFTLYKLRTMDAQGRVTRLGRVLRPTGLDELPQLWNVLRGEMSLIGPRPELPSLVERYERAWPGYRARHAMRPGITGWAQIHGLRGDVSIPERLAYDLDYLRRWSLRLDALILLRTAGAVCSDTLRAWRR